MEEWNNNQPAESQQSKKDVGVLCGLFLGLIGLIIGLLLYKDGTYERPTFIKGWTTAFVAALIIGVVIGIIYYIVIINAINSLILYRKR